MRSIFFVPVGWSKKGLFFRSGWRFEKRDTSLGLVSVYLLKMRWFLPLTYKWFWKTGFIFSLPFSCRSVECRNHLLTLSLSVRTAWRHRSAIRFLMVCSCVILGLGSSLIRLRISAKNAFERLPAVIKNGSHPPRYEKRMCPSAQKPQRELVVYHIFHLYATAYLS